MAAAALLPAFLEQLQARPWCCGSCRAWKQPQVLTQLLRALPGLGGGGCGGRCCRRRAVGWLGAPAADRGPERAAGSSQESQRAGEPLPSTIRRFWGCETDGGAAAAAAACLQAPSFRLEGYLQQLQRGPTATPDAQLAAGMSDAYTAVQEAVADARTALQAAQDVSQRCTRAVLDAPLPSADTGTALAADADADAAGGALAAAGACRCRRCVPLLAHVVCGRQLLTRRPLLHLQGSNKAAAAWTQRRSQRHWQARSLRC